jgi:hypothetical protein
VVPDNTATVDHAFNNRYEAESYLYGCFSYLPAFADAGANPAILGGDEAWFIDPAEGWSPRLWYIARGGQNATAPRADYWASKQVESYGLNGGKSLFTALSDCNIFLENIHKPFDLGDDERNRWIAEVKFLKAYYHFWLFRMYGPVPIIRENLPLSAKGEEAQRYRDPVDDVVAYIVSLIDDAVTDLPDIIGDQQREMGRPTRAIALAIKAQTLVLAASPLFNGTAEKSPEFSLTDNRGVELFPQTYSAEKWQKAAVAAKEAIDEATAAGHKLYDFETANPGYAATVSKKTILAMQVRGAATERWNDEIIWGDSRGTSTDNLQRSCHPVFNMSQIVGPLYRTYAPTLQVVGQFYTENGVPIEEDSKWVGEDPLKLQIAADSDKYYIKPGHETVRLHFNREARFYASIIFDGGTLWGNNDFVDNKSNPRVTHFKNGQPGGGASPTTRHSSTGNVCKKMLHINTTASTNDGAISLYRYAYPIIRLADLYLLYAEALNEAGNGTPDPDVYTYIDTLRTRSGLEGVVDSWRKYAISGKENKPLTKEGMRDIIRRERMNELAFESIRFWDLRRWKLAEEYMNRPILGWNIMGETAEEFYQPTELFSPTFQKKDYFWPIRTSVTLKNVNLVQNPGWN